ncbi:MAG TPA: LamG-like jellyroll fold domain-containing protein, partial [Acidobacteriota bacterium]|nr:LamG-like jellyroll fold domain-containing protein [Acidobacteriota bacterium]
DGTDFMWGNEDNDIMDGGIELDLMFGNENDDTMLGSAGGDLMFGNDGDDCMDGEDDNDIMFGNLGNDRVDGGAGRDLMFGNGNDDTMLGSTGRDLMFGNDGNDCMDGDGDNDFMFGNLGNDRMFGVSGNDFMFGNDGIDCMDGGTDTDYMFGNDDGDTMLGGDHTDFMFANLGHDVMDGDGGSDFMFGNRDNDTMYGGTGNDFMWGNRGDDVMHGGPDFDIMFGGWGGNDTKYDPGTTSSGAACTPCSGTIIIRKNSINGDGTFSYTGCCAPASSKGLLGSFTITTTGGTGSQTFSNIGAGNYTVTELGPLSPWVFVTITFSDPDGGTTVNGQTVNIDLDPGEVVECTFVNFTCAPPPPDMIAWWPLDEQVGATVVTDIVGGHDGTPSPGGQIGNLDPLLGPTPASLWPPAGGGTVADALYFWHQYDNRYVQVPGAPFQFADADFSIDAWVFITQYNATDLQPIVEKMEYSGTTPNRGYRFYLESGVLTFQVAGASSSIAFQVDFADQLSQNVWHHVAATYVGTQPYQTCALYIDGELRQWQSAMLPVGDLSNSSDLIIGGSALGPAINYLNIGIDELEIFERVLASTEVKSIWQADSLGKCPPDTTCDCDCHADPQCDSVTNVLDVVQAVNIAFRGTMPTPDPNPTCPYLPADVDCSGFINVIDVVKFVNVAFRSGDPAVNFCDPCGP